MPATPHVEKHFAASESVRDVVIGMADGLTVPFALAAGLSAAVSTTSGETLVEASENPLIDGARALLALGVSPEARISISLPLIGVGRGQHCISGLVGRNVPKAELLEAEAAAVAKVEAEKANATAEATTA